MTDEVVSAWLNERLLVASTANPRLRQRLIAAERRLPDGNARSGMIEPMAWDMLDSPSVV